MKTFWSLLPLVVAWEVWSRLEDLFARFGTPSREAHDDDYGLFVRPPR
jgi:hypothetical protein